MTKIMIAGIGGVGGYFGGILAETYENSEDVAIYFLARGEHLSVIQEKGLTVRKREVEKQARPRRATDDPGELGKMDFIVLCVKGYDLEMVLQQLKPCIDKETVLIPLLNGVDGVERIQNSFPENRVAEGCTYIVSRLIAPGIIENRGESEKIFFGMEDHAAEKSLVLLEDILKKAGIDAVFSKNIRTVVWEKFIFIAAVATSTSFYDNTVGEIFENPEKAEKTKQLVEEIAGLAAAKGIEMHAEIVEKSVEKMKKLSYETTSSMHSDFISGKQHTELESLTGYIIREAEKQGIQVPVFKQMYGSLKNRSTKG